MAANVRSMKSSSIELLFDDFEYDWVLADSYEFVLPEAGDGLIVDESDELLLIGLGEIVMNNSK